MHLSLFQAMLWKPDRLLFALRGAALALGAALLFLLAVATGFEAVFASHRAFQLVGINALVGLSGIVPVEDLGGDFDLGVLGNHFGRNFHPVHDLDASADNGIVLHVRHGNEIVDLCHAQKVERIRHQGLEAGILDTCNLLCTLEISFRRISSLLSLSRVVDQILGDFSQRSPLFSEIDDDSTSSLLRRLDAFLNGVRQIGATGTNVTAKDITSVAFIVNTACEFDVFVGNGIRITPDVNGQSCRFISIDTKIATKIATNDE